MEKSTTRIEIPELAMEEKEYCVQLPISWSAASEKPPITTLFLRQELSPCAVLCRKTVKTLLAHPSDSSWSFRDCVQPFGGVLGESWPIVMTSRNAGLHAHEDLTRKPQQQEQSAVHNEGICGCCCTSSRRSATSSSALSCYSSVYNRTTAEQQNR